MILPIKNWLYLDMHLSYLVINHLGEPTHFVVDLHLLWVEAECVHLLDKVFHFIVINLLLEHELEVAPLDLCLEQPLDVGEGCSRFDV